CCRRARARPREREMRRDRCRRGGRRCAACGRPRPYRRVRPEGVRRSILAGF
ncbi:unnamed protein product, partial [Ectocarpus sp. 6 AP-2014]